MPDAQEVRPPWLPLWLDEPEMFSCHRPAFVRHRLSEHTLLTLPNLARLAEQLHAGGHCKFIHETLSPAAPFDLHNEDRERRSLDDVFANLDRPGSWVALYNIEEVPSYRALVYEVLAAVQPWVEAQDPGMFDMGGYIFIAMPPAVTPFHIDRDQNFWLQIRGRKRIRLWDPCDRQSVPEQSVERFIAQDDLSEVRLSDGTQPPCIDAVIEAGSGLYIPSTAAHTMSCVEPAASAEPTISMAMVYYTRATRHRAYLYALNHTLRQHGIRPLPPERSVLRDALKYPLAHAVVAGRRFLRGYHPPPGM